MKGIKNAIVVTMMMGVLYAVYVTLSKPDPPLPRDLSPADVAALGPPQVDFGGAVETPPTVESPGAFKAPSAPRPTSQGNKAPPLADRSFPTRGGAYQAEGIPTVDNGPPVAQLPDAIAENPANAEVPVVPDIPPVEQPPSQPRLASRSSIYGTPSEQTTATPSAYSEPSAAAPEYPGPRNPALTQYSLKQDWQQAEQAVQAGKLADALAILSKYYNHPDLSQPDQQQLNKWLDALAGRVIYSQEHHLQPPHKVGAQESLFDVAEQCNVPWQLLQNINAIRDPEILVPGTTLKIVPGPFRSEIDLQRGELTLFLGEMYAGRFPFTLGNEPPQPGEYRIGDKRRDRVYVGDGQRVVNGTDPDNPYGGWWLDLGREASIHGSPRSSNGPTLGCVSLSPQDAKDVYGILSLGSTVTVRR